MEIRLGEKTRALRKEAGLTQEALAEALGVTPGAVYKWESGRAMPELLVEIGDFFETSVDALLRPLWEKVRGEELKRKLSAPEPPSTDGCLPKGNSTGRMKGENQLREDAENENK